MVYIYFIQVMGLKKPVKEFHLTSYSDDSVVAALSVSSEQVEKFIVKDAPNFFKIWCGFSV